MNKRFVWNTVQGTSQANKHEQMRRMWTAHDQVADLDARTRGKQVDADFEASRRRRPRTLVRPIQLDVAARIGVCMSPEGV